MKALSFRQDLGLKIASLILSLLLWLHVQSQESRKTTFPFSVELLTQGTSEGLALVESPKMINVSVTGSPEAIDAFQKRKGFERVRAVVDISDASVERTDYPFRLEPATELKDLETEKAKQIVNLRFEEEQTITKPVEVIPGGDPPSGFQFGSAFVDPPEVRLTGPKSQLSRIGSVRVSISLTNLRSGSTLNPKVEVLDKNGVSMPKVTSSPAHVEVTPALTPAKPKRSLLISPRFTGQPQLGYHVARVDIQPSEAMVQGDRSKISQISLLETQPIDLSGLQRTTTRYVSLKTPPGISVSHARQVKVTVVIEADTPAVSPPPAP